MFLTGLSSSSARGAAGRGERPADGRAAATLVLTLSDDRHVRRLSRRQQAVEYVLKMPAMS
jgi:hypothetical protein